MVNPSNPDPPFSEESPYAVPQSDKYEMTKCEGEKAAREFGKENKFPVVVIRFRLQQRPDEPDG